MNPILIRSYNLFFGWQSLAPARTIVTITLTASPTNQVPVWFRLGPTGPIVALMWPGTAVTLHDVDLSRFWVRGASGDLLLVCGTARPDIQPRIVAGDEFVPKDGDVLDDGEMGEIGELDEVTDA